ncbi:MAG TPA: hypothetical protein VMH86_13385 [Rhizomicrobium sp.]|nr:hypothetical protein [Rhizomicrobium sp.]
MASLKQHLDQIALWLEMDGPVTRGGFNQLCAEIQDLLDHWQSAGAPAHVNVRRYPAGHSIQNWFAGKARPERENLALLGAAIATVAQKRGKTFEPGWLPLTFDALARKLGVRPASDGRATSRYDFGLAIPPDRMERILAKYTGAFYAYRRHATRNQVSRDIIAFGARPNANLMGCRIFRGHQNERHHGPAIPTEHCITAMVSQGVGGDGATTEVLMLRRFRPATRAFAAVRLRLSEGLLLVPTAYRTIMLRRPDLDQAVTVDDQQLLQSRCRDFGPDSKIYRDMIEILSRNTDGKQDADDAVLITDAEAVRDRYDSYVEEE